MSPVEMIQKAMDLHARSVTSRMRVPMGRNLYGRWFKEMRVEFNAIQLGVPAEKIGPAGLKLVQISDIHTGPYLEGPEISWVMDAVTARNPDVIVLTGDFVNRDPAEIYPCLS